MTKLPIIILITLATAHVARADYPGYCWHTESEDLTNDYETNNPGVEDDGVVMPAGEPGDAEVSSICGNINAGHFDDYFYSIDVDNYAVTVTQTITLYFEIDLFANALGPIINDSEQDGEVGMFLVDDPYTVQYGAMWVSGANFFIATLPPGVYQLSVEAYADQQDLTTDIPYDLIIEVD